MEEILIEYKKLLLRLGDITERESKNSNKKYTLDLIWALETELKNKFGKIIRMEFNKYQEMISSGYSFSSQKFVQEVRNNLHGGYFIMRDYGVTEEKIKEITKDYDGIYKKTLDRMQFIGNFQDLPFEIANQIYRDMEKENYKNEYFVKNSYDIRETIKLITRKELDKNINYCKRNIIQASSDHTVIFINNIPKFFRNETSKKI